MGEALKKSVEGVQAILEQIFDEIDNCDNPTRIGHLKVVYDLLDKFPELEEEYFSMTHSYEDYYLGLVN